MRERFLRPQLSIVIAALILIAFIASCGGGSSSSPGSSQTSSGSSTPPVTGGGTGGGTSGSTGGGTSGSTGGGTSGSTGGGTSGSTGGGTSGSTGGGSGSGTGGSGSPPPVIVSLTTYHNDLARTGANTNESILTPANVNAQQFGKLFALSVEGEMYAQPLYLANVNIPGKGIHNVVYVATQHDMVYAFDADGKSTTPLWQRSFINPNAGITPVASTDIAADYEDIQPEVGITSTPVIDPSSGTLYVVAKTNENGDFFQRLHALDVATGADKFGGPVTIQPSVPGVGAKDDGTGNVVFDPLINLQRAALLLLNGTVYIAFGSHGDFDPFNGWLLGYDAHNLHQTIVYAPDPDGAGGSIWQSGDGPAADNAGNIYVLVANGDFDVPEGGRDYGDTALKLQPAGGTFRVLDWFTPFNQQELDDNDFDFGSGGPVLLSDQPSGPPHLLLGGSKEGKLYVINRDNMGHYRTDDDSQIVQTVELSGPLFSTPAVWQDKVYVGALRSSVKCYRISAGHLTLASEALGSFGYPGATPAVSSNGSSNGIVWALQVDQHGEGPAVLHAYDANDLSRELYNSEQAGDRDQAGTAVKFTVPSVVNGKVYVGGGGQLTVYGLLSR
jgi:hypothetical protein